MNFENNSPEEIYKKINESNNILLSLHRGPDGDSLGSCSAMKYFLEKEGKKVKIISPDKLSENFKELNYCDTIEFKKDISEIDFAKENFDLFLSLDISGMDMLTKNKNFKFPKNLFVINFDHHESNSCFGNLNYVSPRKTSTCSILLEFFKKFEVEIDKKLADRLLLGICTDSLFFKIRHAESALKEAAELIEKGGNYQFILDNVLLKESLELKKFFGLIIMNLKEKKIGGRKFAYSVISYKEIKDLNFAGSEIRLGTNEIAFIDGFDFVFTLVETEEHIKGGFRSNYGVDVSRFAKELGGGGHKSAAGFFLPKMPMDEALKKVLKVIDEIGIHN